MTARIRDHAKRRWGGRTYQPILHPDLAHLPALCGPHRFDLIRSHMPFAGGPLLDIGANWGYFCHRFEDEGFRCVAVEREPAEYYFLEKLRIAEGREFKTVKASIFDFQGASEFDVVLAMSIFHHFLKTEINYQRLVRFLRSVKTRVLFFEPHVPGESQMAGAHRNLDNEAFVRFVAENTGLQRWTRIGYGIGGRPIYRGSDG